MKFRSDDKKINQYMLHAIEIHIFETGNLVEFERGLDAGYAIFKNGKVVETFVRDKHDFKVFKNNRCIDEVIKELNEEWLINKI